MNPGDAEDPPGETHGHGVAVASGFHVGRGTQLFEKLNLAPYAALLAAQVPLFFVVRTYCNPGFAVSVLAVDGYVAILSGAI